MAQILGEMLQEEISLKRYVFYYKDYPLGQMQFDEEKSEGQFTYVYTSSAPLRVDRKPEIVITLLEEIRHDAMDFKTEGEFNDYMRTKLGDFHFVPLKGYE